MSATQMSDFYASNASDSWEIVQIVDQQTSGPVITVDDRVAISPCGSYACINIHPPGNPGAPKLLFDKGVFVSGQLVHEDAELVFSATLDDKAVLYFEVYPTGSGSRAPADGEAEDDPE